MSVLRVAAVQHDIVWESRAETLGRLAPRVQAAVAAGSRLVVLSEMFAVGFSMRTEVTGESADGPSTAWLLQQAEQHDVWICGTIPVRTDEADLPFNTFVLAGPAGQLHRYR